MADLLLRKFTKLTAETLIPLGTRTISDGGYFWEDKGVINWSGCGDVDLRLASFIPV